MFREAGFTADGAVLLGIGLMPHFQRIVLACAVPQFVPSLDKAGQHVQQFPCVQGGQAGGQGRGARCVIKRGQQGQMLFVQAHDAITVPHGVPVACIVFDAAHLARAVMGKTGLHSLGGEQVGQAVETGLFLFTSVDIEAEFGMMIDFSKQLEFILELEMCP